MPHIIPSDLPPPIDMPKGMICDTYGDVEDQFILRDVVFPVIRDYQRDKWGSLAGQYPGGLDAVHSIIKITPPGVNEWLSVTVPEADIVRLEITNESRYSFHEYRWLTYFDPPAWEAFDKFVDATVGTPYDIPQLIDIWMRQNLGWLPAPRLELGSQQTICSAGCAGALLAAHNDLWKRRNAAGLDVVTINRRPIPPKGDGYPYLAEDTCPADFAMLKTRYAQPWQIGVEIDAI